MAKSGWQQREQRARALAAILRETGPLYPEDLAQRAIASGGELAEWLRGRERPWIAVGCCLASSITAKVRPVLDKGGTSRRKWHAIEATEETSR